MKTLETNKIRIPINNEKSISLLRNPTLMMAALFGTGGAIGFISAKSIDTYEPSETAELSDAATESTDFVEIPMESAMLSVDASHSFSEAFAHSREQLGPGGIFEYKGSLYNTYYKEEWNEMAAPQKEDYFADFQNQVSGDINHISHNDQVTKISIDHDSEPEITLIDNDSDGLIDEIILANNPDVSISESDPVNLAESAEEINSDDSFSDFESEFIDMSEGGFNFEDDIPEAEEVVVNLASEDISQPQLNDSSNTGNVVELGEGDISDPSEGENTVELEEGDLTDPSEAGNVVELEEDDLSDPSEIETYLEDYFEEGDLVDPSSGAPDLELGSLEEPMNGGEWDF